MKTTLVAALIATGLMSGAGYAQNNNQGLVVVAVGDINIIRDALNNPNFNIAVPVNVQVPVGIAANVCDVNANVLAKQKKDGTAECTAKNTSTALNKAIVEQLGTQ